MTIFQKRENEQFTPPASLSSAPAVVNSFVTIVCMDSATPYICNVPLSLNSQPYFL